MIKVRLTGDSREDIENAIDYIQAATKGIVKMGKPREGSNPKYAGDQKWFAYGDAEIPPLKSKRGVPL